MGECLPRLCLEAVEDAVVCGSGPYIDVVSKRCRRKVRIFDKEGSHVFGVSEHENDIVAYGERSIAGFSFSSCEVDRDEMVLPETQVCRFSDSILKLKLLSNHELIVLFTCNNIVRFKAHFSTNSFSLVKLEEVQSEHVAVLLNGLLVGHSWSNLISIVGTVFGEILISQPSTGFDVQRKLEGHTGMIFGLLHHGQYLYSISDDRSLRVWNLNPEEPLRDDAEQVDCQYGHSARPFAICADEKRGFIYTSGIDQIICKWFIEESGKLRLVDTISLNIGGVRSLVVHDRKLYIGSENGGLLSLRISDDAILDSRALDCSEDVRGFVLCSSQSIYTVDGRGRVYCDKVICSSDDKKYRYLVCTPAHYDERIIVAYGDKNILVISEGKNYHVLTVKHRILSVVCTDQFIFAHTVEQLGYLYNRYGIFICCFSMRDITNLMKKKSTMIPSSMDIIININQHLIIGTTSGHLLFAPIGRDDQTVEFTSTAEMTRSFKNCHIMSIRSEKEVSTILCKNGEVSKWKLINGGTFRHISSSSASDCVTLDWPYSLIYHEGKEYIAGFHSTDFLLVERNSRLCVLTIPCGGGNRAWNFKLESVDHRVIGTLFFIRDQLLLSVTGELRDFTEYSPSLHRSQIVSIHNFADKEIFCTFGTDSQLVVSSLSHGTGTKDIVVLKRISDPVGFLSIDSFVNSSGNVIFVTGGNKGFVTLWQFSFKSGLHEIDEDSMVETMKYQQDSCTRVLHVQFLRGQNDEIVHPLMVSTLFADGSIGILVEENCSSMKCLASIQSSDLSLFTKAHFFEDHNGRKVIIAVSTSGMCSLYELIGHELIMKSSIVVAKCGLSCLDVFIKYANVYLAIGTESGDVHILQLASDRFSPIGAVQYHAATVTALELFGTRDVLSLISTSLDCRLAEHTINFSGQKCAEFVKSRCLSIWDPSSFIRIQSKLIVVGSGVETIEC